MKNLKINLLFIFLLTLTLGLTSCGGNNDKTDDKVENHQDGDKHADEHEYACPMHPEITGKAGDKCSKCGMDLKMVEDDDHKDHNH